MEATIRVGQTVTAQPVSNYQGSRGDIVVIRRPANWGTEIEGPDPEMLKRVVAVAGETIQCCDSRNRVLVNGSPLDEPYVYYLPSAGSARQDTFGPVTVPAGMIWLMGDSRNNSADSRVPGHGPVSRQAVEALVKVSDPSPASNASTPASKPSPTAATKIITLTPVRNSGPAGGTPAPGWQIIDDTTTTVDCGQPSPAARSSGIHSCSPTAADANACWPAPEGFVYCLRDPWKKSLTQMPASNTSVAVLAPARPEPLGIALADGIHCLLRNGGADSGRPTDPNLYITYYCGGRYVWGDAVGRSTGGIDQSTTTWQVRTGTTTGPLHSEIVTQAYFVGN